MHSDTSLATVAVDSPNVHLDALEICRPKLFARLRNMIGSSHDNTRLNRLFSFNSSFNSSSMMSSSCFSGVFDVCTRFQKSNPALLRSLNVP